MHCYCLPFFNSSGRPPVNVLVFLAAGYLNAFFRCIGFHGPKFFLGKPARVAQLVLREVVESKVSGSSPGSGSVGVSSNVMASCAHQGKGTAPFCQARVWERRLGWTIPPFEYKIDNSGGPNHTSRSPPIVDTFSFSDAHATFCFRVVFPPMTGYR
jgi:hypothetical protein